MSKCRKHFRVVNISIKTSGTSSTIQYALICLLCFMWLYLFNTAGRWFEKYVRAYLFFYLYFHFPFTHFYICISQHFKTQVWDYKGKNKSRDYKFTKKLIRLRSFCHEALLSTITSMLIFYVCSKVIKCSFCFKILKSVLIFLMKVITFDILD